MCQEGVDCALVMRYSRGCAGRLSSRKAPRIRRRLAGDCRTRTLAHIQPAPDCQGLPRAVTSATPVGGEVPGWDAGGASVAVLAGCGAPAAVVRLLDGIRRAYVAVARTCGGKVIK